MRSLYTQHAVALTGPLILPSQAFDSPYSRVENISAAPALRNSAASSAAPKSKRPSIPKRGTRRLTIGESSQHSCESDSAGDVLNTVQQ